MSDEFSILARFKSMRFAMDGFRTLLREEHNARVHLFLTMVALVLAAVLGFSAEKWVLLLLMIGLVWLAEAFNSAIEYLCNRVTTEQDEWIMRAKDVAAAGVLIASVVSFIGGLILYVPPLLRLIA